MRHAAASYQDRPILNRNLGLQGSPARGSRDISTMVCLDSVWTQDRVRASRRYLQTVQNKSQTIKGPRG